MDKGKNFNDIFDLLALRVFVNTKDECYHALGIIHSKFKPMPKRFKDYVAMPKTNMYQSLHTTVFGVDESLFEIQIRTYEMDEIAENGIASHWSYKEKGSVRVDMQNEMEQKLQFFKTIMELKGEEETDENFVKSVQNDILISSIYIYTPKGDVFELPKGSTPIDFAYKIHTKVGDHMVGAIVNGSIVPLDYELQNNDIVKINTNNNSNPSREWINIVKTSSARNKIKSYFNKIDKEDFLKLGTEIITKELKKQHITYNEFFTEENIKKILEVTKLSSVEEVLRGIGINNNVNQILNIILKQNDTKEELVIKKAQNNEVKKVVSDKDILVGGIDDVKINIASCCKPVPGDDIVGYITKGYGISIHKVNCPNVASLDERIIAVSWNENIKNKYLSTIIVRALTEDNLLLEIVSKTSGTETKVQSIVNIAKGKNVGYEITVSVSNLETLTKFIHDIESMSKVISVERVIK